MVRSVFVRVIPFIAGFLLVHCGGSSASNAHAAGTAGSGTSTSGAPEGGSAGASDATGGSSTNGGSTGTTTNGGSGGDASAGSAGAPPYDGCAFLSPDCAACQTASCQAQLDACSSSSKCDRDLLSPCVCTQQGAANAMGVAMCQMTFANDGAEASALVACFQQSCAMPCGL